jgi:hypothetical protein
MNFDLMNLHIRENLFCHAPHCSFLIFLFFVIPCVSFGQLLDQEKTLKKFDFWTNTDWEWYEENIPILETPNSDIDLTYYYRWEMMTGKMIYGSPESGYASTEFTDRPWWSGSFGTISCPAGHQLYEFRWFRNRKFSEDYAKYWYADLGGELYNYTNWVGDAVWKIHEVYQDDEFTLSLLPKLTASYVEWGKQHYVPSEGMFAWDGMHDGMETNINSRQTKDWFAGAPGYRTTLNSYMWAHAKAISNIAKIAEDRGLAEYYTAKADTIKFNLLQNTWDPKRSFFFHRFQNDEQDGIKANTLTYETGKYAGNEHGREEIGFIPWYFNLPDSGYEEAWKYLMDSTYFFSAYGPTVTEQNDPLYRVAENCCQWSGNSWPFATAQTLKAMANVIRNYDQNYVDKEDYYQLLDIFARTHRKNDKPYIAEAANPYTGSWDGHDKVNHSEHYFHSSYIDLVITGLIGLQPTANDSIIVKPLIPDNWDYFALQNIRYHGHDITIVWDRDGSKYQKGEGLFILSDGQKIASSPTLSTLAVPLLPRPLDEKSTLVNYAVNNTGDKFYPHVSTSFPGIGDHNYLKLNDGQYWYYKESTGNRWTSEFSKSPEEFIQIELGNSRSVEEIKLYIYGNDSSILAPKSYEIEYRTVGNWISIPDQQRNPLQPKAGMANTITFEGLDATAIRIKFETINPIGISEIEVWGEGKFPIIMSEKPKDNLSKRAQVYASFVSRFDTTAAVNDGIIGSELRWTNFESPNKKDYLIFDFQKETSFSSANIFIFSDNGGVQAPEEYYMEYWDQDQWLAVTEFSKLPLKPIAGLNRICFKEIVTNKLKVTFVNAGEKIYSGCYEVQFD